MRKQEQEALRRLEAALMEPEPTEEIPMEEDEDLDDIWQELTDIDYDIYNTDDTDVDLDDYSEDVHRGSRKNPFLTIFMIFSLLLLAFSIFVLIKFLGVI